MQVKHHFQILSFLFLSAFLFQSNSSFSQAQIHYQQFTTDQRLSENVVYCLLQDQRGFIWAGTHHGLNRYDGYGFKRYYTVNNDSTTLSDNTIFCMFDDGSGKLWIGTRQGLNRFDPITGKSERLQFPGKGLNYRVSNIYTLNRNALLLHIENEIYVFRIKTNEWIKTKSFPPYLGLGFYSLPGGKIGIGCTDNGGFYLYDEIKQEWYCEGSLQGFPVTTGTVVSNYFIDSKGNHYLYSFPNSFQVFNAKGRRIAMLDNKFFTDEQALLFFTFSESPDGKTWMSTNKGLFQFDHNSEKLSQVTLVGNKPSIDKNTELRYALLDKDQHLWLGVFGEGILKCRIRKSPFYSIELDEITEKSFGRMIYGLYEWKEGAIVAETGYLNFSVIRNENARTIEFTNAKKLGLEGITG